MDKKNSNDAVAFQIENCVDVEISNCRVEGMRFMDAHQVEGLRLHGNTCDATQAPDVKPWYKRFAIQVWLIVAAIIATVAAAALKGWLGITG